MMARGMQLTIYPQAMAPQSEELSCLPVNLLICMLSHRLPTLPWLVHHPLAIVLHMLDIGLLDLLTTSSAREITTIGVGILYVKHWLICCLGAAADMGRVPLVGSHAHCISTWASITVARLIAPLFCHSVHKLNRFLVDLDNVIIDRGEIVSGHIISMGGFLFFSLTLALFGVVRPVLFCSTLS